MKIVLNIVFILAALASAYYLMESIRRPVDFRDTWAERKTAVQEKLEEIAELQKMYTSIKGDTLFAASFEELETSFLKDSFFILKIEGDPFDTTITPDTTELMYPARDSVLSFIAAAGKLDQAKLKELQGPALEIMENWQDTSQDVRQDPAVAAYLDFAEAAIKDYFKKIRSVPFSDNKEFVVAAGEVAMEGRRAFGRRLPTFEVKTMVGDYMKEYSVKEYGMYDPSFDHKAEVKVGDLTKPSTTGNW